MFFKIISIIGSLTLVSRVLGYIRDLLIARFLGAGLVSDAFFVSFKFLSTAGAARVTHPVSKYSS